MRVWVFLPGAFQSVATEPAKQLLGAMSYEDDANGNAQGKGAPASVGVEQFVEECIVHDPVSLCMRCVLSMGILYEYLILG